MTKELENKNRQHANDEIDLLELFNRMGKGTKRLFISIWDIFLKQQKLEPKKNFYIPCSNIEIIQRLILNLVFAYDQSGNKAKANMYKELLDIIREE